MSPIDPKQEDQNDPIRWARDEFEFPQRQECGADGKGLVHVTIVLI